MNLKEEIKKASEYYALSKAHKNRAWVSVGIRQEDHDKVTLLAKECKLPIGKILSIIINEAYYKLKKEA